MKIALITSLAVVLVITLSIVPGCAQEAAEAEEAAAEEVTIGISTDAGYPARMIEVIGIYEEAEKAGNVTVVEQNADNDSSKQIQQVKALVDQGVDAVVICAVDMNAIQTALNYAAEKGVIVTLYDRFVDNPNVQFTGGYNSYKDGTMCAEALLTFDDGQQHTVFELVGNLADTNALARRDGFHSIIDMKGNFEVVQILTDWATDEALTGVKNALQNHPDVWGIFNASSHMDGSIQTALSEAGLLFKHDEEGHVYWVSLGEEPPGPEIFKDGYVDVALDIPFDQMGAQIYKAIMKLLDGEELVSDVFFCETYPITQDTIDTDYEKMWAVRYADKLGWDPGI
jgi:ABC-type sugar transport system substrate-binding protein